MFDPREWVLQHKTLKDLRIQYREKPHITPHADMWALLSPKALLTKHDYICWDESNHDVMVLIGRSWVKTAQWSFEEDTQSPPQGNGAAEDDDVIMKLGLRHYMDLSGDLEATVVSTSFRNEQAQANVSFLSDAGAILVLVSKANNVKAEKNMPLASIVMKAVKSEQRVLCVGLSLMSP